MEQKEKDALLKKAKKAVFWGIMFNRSIPPDFHCMMVSLECCSKFWLKHYFRDNFLEYKAEVLMVELYAENAPELIADYIHQHRSCISGEMQVKIIESKNLNLIKKISRATGGYLHCFKLHEKAQTALVSLNDTFFFTEVFKLFPCLCDKAVTALIEQQNIEMFEVYLKSMRFKDISLSIEHQKVLYKEGNSAMIDCFLRYDSFDSKIIHSIIEQGNTDLFGKVIQKNKLRNNLELFLAQSGSKKMIAQYINEWPFHPEAQIELAKSNHKDLLKLHYLKHSVSQQVLLYVLGLSYFKEYLDMKI